jgi:ABC-type transport system involved in multi-copper enzyme maturation permease subunit
LKAFGVAFWACFRAEIGDLARQPLAWLGAVATIVTALVVGLGSDAKNGWLVYQAALQWSAVAAGFFLLGIAAGTIASDRTRGTVRWILPRPISRAAYVLGKSAAVLLLAVDLLACAAGTSYFVAAPKGFDDISATKSEEDEFGFIEEETVPTEFQAASLRSMSWAATFRILPALWTLAGLGLLISSLFRSAAGAVMASIAAALPLHFLPELLNLSPSQTRMLPQRAAAEAIAQLEVHGRRWANTDWPDYSTGTVVGALICCAGFPILAALIFSRLDITD